MKHYLTCPVCGQTFTPDAQHRFGGNCSAICAAKATPPPRMTVQRVTRNLTQTIIAPHLNRRAPGGTNRRQTE